MARVAAQAQKRRRLVQKVVGHRPVWIVTKTAVLRHRRVFPDKRPLLLRVALITEIVHRFRLQVPLGLAVAVMAVGADHFALLDGVVRWHRRHSTYLRMAFEARGRLVDRHRHSLGATDRRVADVDHSPYDRTWMGVVAVRAGNTFPEVDRRVPRHRWGALVALQAEVRPGRRRHLSVRAVARIAIEAVRPKNLMCMGDFLQFAFLGVAAIANVRLVD